MASTLSHTHTVSTAALCAGDAVLGMGGAVVASVERDMSNLGAALIRFTDGAWWHVGMRDAHMIHRA
jgi:hypothetical protein